MGERHSRSICLAVLLLVALLSHAVEFSGSHDCNPLQRYSGLAMQQHAAAWAGQCFIDGNAGLTLQALGHRAAEDWLGFRLPWWNPYAGIGMPLAAEMQPAAFFLPFVLLLHFTSGLLLLKIASQFTAGVCMLYCLHTLELGRNAALFGALLYELDGTFAWYGDAPMLPLPFLPLLIGGIQQASASAKTAQPGGIIAIAAGIGFSLLAGFPETAFLNGILAAFWAAMRLLETDGRARSRMAGKLLVGGLAGIALAAPALVTFLDYLASGAETYRGLVQVNQLHAGQEATLLLPTLFGPPYYNFSLAWGEAGGYLGPALVLPGLVTLLAHTHHHRLRWLAIAWTLFWLAVFLGEPATRLVWQMLPLVNQAVVTRYAMPSIAFLWTVLAALGWEQSRTSKAGSRRALLLFLSLAVGALSHALWVGRIAYPAGWTLAWIVVISISFAVLTRKSLEGAPPVLRQHASQALATMLLVDALISFMVPQLAGRPMLQSDQAPVRFLRSQTDFARSYALNGLLEPNYGSYFGVPTLQAFSLPAAPLWVDYARGLDPRVLGEMFAPSTLTEQAKHLQAARAAFEDAGVGYLLVPPLDDPIPDLHDPHFVLTFESPAARIYRLPGALPYMGIVSGGPCTVASATREKSRIVCAAPAVLLRREMFDPGWYATVNGAGVPVARADGVFQSVKLPIGTSQIRFRYVPAHARLMAGMLAAAFCLLGISLFRVCQDATNQGARIVIIAG